MAQPRILVAEDERIFAIDLRDTVEEAGFQVEGPHSDISSAMLSFEQCRPDLAILEVPLDDEVVLSLAQKLSDENIPIIFHSVRRNESELARRFPKATTLPKPCPPADMIHAVSKGLQTV